MQLRCPYCQVDRTTPGGPAAVDVAVLRAELSALLDRVRSGALWLDPPFAAAPPLLRRVADVAFAGDGGPMAPAEFPAAARIAREAIAAGALGVPLRLLTNASLLRRPRGVGGRSRCSTSCG